MTQVELRGVSKTYPGGVKAVSALDLTVGDDELFVIVGPSGSGKSTLLRLIAGLEAPGVGSVWIGGVRADGLAPRDRDVAMVFQEPALYPHLSVFENLAFGLRARGRPASEVSARVSEVAASLGLFEVLSRRPATLSGGQRQRVALGRAIARRPRVLLLDEPFSNLDAPLRASLRALLIDLHRQSAATMLHVTHDQAEALALGDRVAIMDRGRVVQSGTPRDLYDRPATRFVAEFLGSPPMSLLPCAFEISGDSLRIRVAGLEGGSAWTTPAASVWAAPLRRLGAGRVDMGLRPEHLTIAEGPSSPAIGLPAEIRRLEPLGHETIAALAVGPHALGLRLPASTPLRAGDRVTVGIDPGRATWFDAETGTSLSA